MGRFETLCNEYRENKRLIEELKAENDSLKAAIISLMGDRETVTEGAAKATIKTVNSTRFDSTGFKKQFPDLFGAFSKTMQYQRFTVV